MLKALEYIIELKKRITGRNKEKIKILTKRESYVNSLLQAFLLGFFLVN
jgi:hypothetical protein